MLLKGPRHSGQCLRNGSVVGKGSFEEKGALTTLLYSEGQQPSLVHPEFSADTLHVAGAWLTSVSE